MKHAHTISWVLFGALAVVTILLSLTSVLFAYANPDGDLIAGKFTPAEVANGDEELAAALSARRGTAAAFSLAYGILLLGATLRYRRKRCGLGWMAGAGLANAVVILLRVPVLGIGWGVVTGLGPLLLLLAATGLGLAARSSAAA